MSYLEEFKTQINLRNSLKFLQLWEEYCHGDGSDHQEIVDVLELIKASDFTHLFGPLAETALPLWKLIGDKEASYRVLKLLIDLQTTNSSLLADLAYRALEERYGSDPRFSERIRLVGLKTKEVFQGALSSYDILFHMQKGKFVYHTGGWGVGEIMDVSPIRQQVTVEFEFTAGKKHLSFENAFKVLIPLKDQHFLAERFASPDALEKKARENPVEVIKMLLKDLGPKTAAEIKDELSGIVIPEESWAKWWQATRAKLKKDPYIESPEGLKEPFSLRKNQVTHEERVSMVVHKQHDVDDLILASYNFSRDLPASSKNKEASLAVKDKLLEKLKSGDCTESQKIQVMILLESFFDSETTEKSEDLILTADDPAKIVNAIEIIALKKRVLVAIRKLRKDWKEIFLNLLMSVRQSALRDYLLKELNCVEAKPLLEQKLKDLLIHPERAPDCFVWYFQKVLDKKRQEEVPFSDKKGKEILFEAFLVLFSRIESLGEHRELVKKMYTALSGKRFASVRELLEGTSLEYTKEFLLLVSKCQTLTDHDVKILHSLAEVVHPSLAALKKSSSKSGASALSVIWTTEEGYLKTQEQIRHIGTVEVVENAREIEAARALGDLRENSEYKFALEKRSRLQGQLKMLSDQLKLARILTREDVVQDEVGVGTIVEVSDKQGVKIQYTILGPWDAKPEENILSFQSKLAEALTGAHVGEVVQYRDEEFKILSIRSFFDK